MRRVLTLLVVTVLALLLALAALLVLQNEETQVVLYFSLFGRAWITAPQQVVPLLLCTAAAGLVLGWLFGWVAGATRGRSRPPPQSQKTSGDEGGVSGVTASRGQTPPSDEQESDGLW